MKLYHGTSWDRATNIFKEGFITISSKENSPYQNSYKEMYKTEEGFVYLTNDEFEAKKYGNNALILLNNRYNEKDEWICVFEVSLDISELLPDKNECNLKQKSPFPSDKFDLCRVCNYEYCLEKIRSVRCPRNLLIGKDVLRYKRYNPKEKFDNVYLFDWVNIELY